MNEIIEVRGQTAIIAGDDRLHDAIAFLADNVAPSSRRQYLHTYREWEQFSQAYDGKPHDFNEHKVRAFLNHKPLSKRTKQARLTHIRRLLTVLSAKFPDVPEYDSWLKLVKEMKVKAGDDTGREQDLERRLTPDEIHAAINRWGADSMRHRRNKAFLAVLFYAGLRRAEAVALMWDDIDLATGIVTVRHGKGDKPRTIPFAGETAVKILRDWFDYLQRCEQGHRRYVFPQMVKGDNLAADDVPMSADSAYRITKASGDFSPHVARRTLLTELLKSGTSLPDTQFVAGHAHGSTTMHYAKVADALEVKGRLRVSY